MAKAHALFADRGAPAIGVVDALESLKSDTVNLTQPIRGFYVGTTGDVKLMTPDGSTATFKTLPAGVVISCEAIRIFSTDTTATDLVGLY